MARRHTQGRGSFDEGRSGSRDRGRVRGSHFGHESGYGGGRESSPDWEPQGRGRGSLGEGERQGGEFGGGTSTFGRGFTGQQGGFGGYPAGEYEGGYQGGQGRQFGSSNWGGPQGGFGGGQEQPGYPGGQYGGLGGQQRGFGAPQGGFGQQRGFGGGYGSEQAWGSPGSQGGISYVGRGPKGYRRSDERIKEDVSDRLEQHPQIDAIDIEVMVEGGIVTLSGTVPDRQMKRLAEDAVEVAPGVREVSNQLRVARPGEQGQAGQPQTQTERSSTSKR